MGRIRTIKPDIARHELLFDLELETGLPIRFAWCMLFTACDREGRFKWRPRALKAEVLPFDDVDFSRVLDAWLTRGLLVKYRVNNQYFGAIPSWAKHQSVNHRESPSGIPSPDEADEVEDHRNQQLTHASGTRAARVDHACTTAPGHAPGERKGMERVREDPPSSPPRGGKPEKNPKPAPDWKAVENLDLEAWEIWLAHRRAEYGKAPYKTTRVATMLARFPADVQRAAVQQSMEKNWQGLFPEKVNANGQDRPTRRTSFEAARERLSDWLESGDT